MYSTISFDISIVTRRKGCATGRKGCATRRKGVATRRKGVVIVFCSFCKLLKYNMVDTACFGNINIQRIIV